MLILFSYTFEKKVEEYYCCISIIRSPFLALHEHTNDQCQICGFDTMEAEGQDSNSKDF